jgi:lipid-A-disaccharide synthase
MRIYLVAGESSGDAHGSALMRELRALLPDAEFYGAGGSQMKAMAGDHFEDWSSEAVVGLWDVLVKYPYFRRQFYRMYDEITGLQPDAVIFIDYPGFNLRLAERLHRRRFSGKLIYYVSPQVWAWNRSRIPRMARFLDLMMCIFPFEKSLYEASGLRTEFVGHPMVEELERHRIRQPREADLVALMPGSRKREVKRIFPVMLEAARLLHRRDPKMRFEASAASSSAQEMMQQMLQPNDKIEIRFGNAATLMQRAAAGMVASGTATLESSFFHLPFVLVYKVSWLTYIPGRMLIRVNYLGMPNILAGKEIVPEFIQKDATPERIADAVWRLYSDEGGRKSMVHEMDRVVTMLGEKGAGKRAAEVVVRELTEDAKV